MGGKTTMSLGDVISALKSKELQRKSDSLTDVSGEGLSIRRSKKQSGYKNRNAEK